MLTLILFRHATAAKAVSGQTDHDRPLTQQGRLEARRAGRRLSETGVVLDLAICSTSARTRETLAFALEAVAVRPEIRYLRALFEADDYFPTIRREAGDARSVLVVGHNPLVQEAAVSLAKNETGRPGLGFPPSAFAVLTWSGPWGILGENHMRLEHFVTP